jgi:hypothetical protein
MIYRIFASKDTFLTNFRVSNVARTGSNVGASEILKTFRVAPVSTSFGEVSGSSARALIKFDLEPIAAMTASREAPVAGISYRLRMRHVVHAETLPSSFDLELFPVARDWDEGRGDDVDRYVDLGFANWDKAKSNVFWTNPGGDFVALPRREQHFDYGDEDLSVDVTPIVNAWLTGGLANHGFMLKMSSSLESGSTDYYVKMFYSRATSFVGREPYLEASWDDSTRDDRNNFVFDYTGSLFLYHRVRGQLVDITGIGTGSNVLIVRITDLSGTVKHVSGSHTGVTGIYSASFAIATASYSGSRFSDIWLSGAFSGSSGSLVVAKVYMTCSFTPADNFGLCTSRVSPYFVSMPNLKSEYERDEVVRMNIFVRQRDYNPAVVLTASATPQGLVVTKGYYRIDDDRTDDVVIPFGTGSTETTRLSYDADGNYFKFHMRSLPPGAVYRVVYLLDIDGQRQVVDKGFKFRVV